MSWRGRRCPTENELARGFTDGPSDRLERHLQRCPRCAAESREHKRLVALARQLPVKELNPARADELRRAVMGRADQLRPAARGRVASQPPATAARRWRWVAAGVAATVCAAAALLVLWPSNETAAPTVGSRDEIMSRTGPTEEAPSLASGEGEAAPVAEHEPPADPPYRGAILSHVSAVFMRVGEPPDEVVRLIDGALTVEVKPLRPGERFRVVTEDAEVEVRGTAFDVRAVGDRLEAVRVIRGRVEVRPLGGPAVVLEPGARWQLPEVTVDEPAEAGVQAAAIDRQRAEPVSVAKRDPRPVGRGGSAPPPAAVEPAPPEPEPSPAERAFQRGWSALRSGDPAAAAAAFEQLSTANPGSSLAEDAAFWRAVALARDGRHRAAAAGLAAFLDRYPRSLRAGEAGTMLGWSLLKRADLDGAERRFAAAQDDPVARVRASARAGLEEISKRRVRRLGQP